MNGKVIALALGLSVGFSSSVGAAISPGDGAAGNPPGEIFVTIWDSAHQVSYTRDLGLAVANLVANPNQGLTFSPDALYNSTFAGVNPNTLVYSVGGFNARFDDFPCCYGMVISSNNTPAQVSVPDVTALVTTLATGGFYAAGVNADAGGDVNNFTLNVSAVSHPGSSGYYDGDNWGGDIGFTVPFQTGATVGTDLAFYTVLLAEDGFSVTSTKLSNKWNVAADGTIRYLGSVDSDGDGLADSSDNCIGKANANQRDADNDGIGSACDSDLDNNCVVNFLDLGTFKSVFFTSNENADFDNSGSVNFTDLALMKEQFMVNFANNNPSGVPNDCAP